MRKGSFRGDVSRHLSSSFPPTPFSFSKPPPRCRLLARLRRKSSQADYELLKKGGFKLQELLWIYLAKHFMEVSHSGHTAGK